MKLIAFSRLALPAVATFVLTGSSGYSQTPAPGGTLLSFDFETKRWPKTSVAAVGTVDVAGSAQQNTRPSKNPAPWYSTRRQMDRFEQFGNEKAKRDRLNQNPRREQKALSFSMSPVQF